MKKYLYLIWFILMSIFAVDANSKQRVSDHDRDMRACQAIVKPSTKNGQAYTSIAYIQIDEKIEKILRDRDSYGSVAKVDINSDGKPEYVVLVTEGTAHISHFEIFDSNWNPIKIEQNSEYDWESDNIRWASDMELIQFEGRAYILASTDNVLHYLSRIDSNNVENIVCQFAHSDVPTEKLIESKNDQLCRSALAGGLNYSKFEHLHSLSREGVQRQGFSESGPGEKAAKVDIDNDGIQDYIVQLELASGRGRGCDSLFLGVLNDARNQLDIDRTKLISEKSQCGTEQKPFVFDGETYIDQHDTDVHEIWKLNKGELKTICKFEVSQNFYVLGEAESIVADAKAAYISPMDVALNTPGLRTFTTLLDSGLVGDLTTIQNLNGQGDRTIPVAVIMRRRDDLLKYLLDKGMDPNSKSNDDEPDGTILFRAVWNGSTDAVKLILEKGGNPRILPKHTWDGLITDLINNRENEPFQRLELLLQHGADPDEIITRIFIKPDTQDTHGLPQILRDALRYKNSPQCPAGADPETFKVCLPKSLRGTEEKLNELYKKQLLKAGANAQTKLRIQQRQWVKQRDLTCKLHFKWTDHDGWLSYVLSDATRAQCVLQETMLRVVSLQ